MERESLPVEEIEKLINNPEKTHEEVENWSRDILSDALYNEKRKRIELENEIKNPNEIDDYFKDKLPNLTQEDLDKNIKNFSEKISQAKELEFINELKKQFSDGKFYLVGGAVRDGALGLKSNDYDVVIAGIEPEKLEESLKNMGRVDLVGKNFGAYKFKGHGSEVVVDIVLPRKEWSQETGSRKDFRVETDYNLPIEDDLSRRDLTINAMAYDYVKKEIIDPFDGQKDLANKTIRAVGEPSQRINEDYSRMLRTIRFASKFGFKIDENTFAAICDNASKINTINSKEKRIVSWENIGVELEKSFCCESVRTLDLLDKTGLLQEVLPEIEKMKDVKQPVEHHQEGDVYTHTRLALRSLPENATPSLVFATLLHDVGKPEKYHKDENGKISFKNHAQAGARIAEEICKKLRFDNKFTDKVVFLVKNHMKVFAVRTMGESTLQKLLFDPILADNPKDLLYLNLADNLSSLNNRPTPLDKIRYDIAIKRILQTITKFEIEKNQIKPLVNGDDLIRLGFQEGPDMKKHLETAINLQSTDKTKEEILEILKSDLD